VPTPTPTPTAATGPRPQPEAEPITTLTLHIPNISCAHCVHTIQTEVGELPGVNKVEANPQTKLVTVGFDAPATRAGIEALLAEIDYPAA
jgi:copper chaperone